MKIKFSCNFASIKEFLIDKALILVLGFIIILIIGRAPAFFQYRVFKDILIQSSVKIIVALGMMIPLLLGGTDLAGGRQVGLAAVIVASLSQMSTYASLFWPNLPELPIFIPIMAALAAGSLIGLMNGMMIVKFKMAPFIATYAMSTIVYGANCLYYAKEPNNAQPLGGIRSSLTNLVSYKFFGKIDCLLIIALTAIIIIWFLLNKTAFGKKIYAVGGNPEAAKVAGINVGMILIAGYIIESNLVSFAGILEVARTGGANSAYGLNYDFDAIAACVVGGVSLSGGIGKVSGAVLGVFIFTIISYGLAFVGVNPNWQLIVKGVIIAVAVALDMRKNVR
jgi:methyl-galactoside transport system permease protein